VIIPTLIISWTKLWSLVSWRMPPPAHHVGAAVPDVAQVQLVASDQRHHAGRAHPVAADVGLGVAQDGEVGPLDGLLQHLVRLAAGVVALLDLGEELLDRLDRQPAGDLARRVAAHAVTDGQDVLARALEDQEGVLVVVAAPRVRDGPRVHLGLLGFLHHPSHLKPKLALSR
jgi:hypothetical protein